MAPAHPLAPRIAAAMREATLVLGRHPALGDVAEVAGFTCIDAGLGVSSANVALPTAVGSAAMPALREVAAWFAARGLNFRVDLPADAPSDLMAAAMTLGLRFRERQPVMLLGHIWPGPLPGELDVRPVADDRDVEQFCAIDTLEFEDDPLLASIVAAAREHPAVRLLTGFLEGRPVARIAVMLHRDLATLHSLYVHPVIRRRGLGTEMTLRALALARTEGAGVAALASTLAAVPLYERLGFETIGATIVMGCDGPLS